MITEEGFDARADIRGIMTCPILSEGIKTDYAFTRQVRKVARLFSRDEELTEYICNVNSMLDEIQDFAVRTTDE